MRKLPFLTIAILAVLPTSLRATTLPDYDVATYCNWKAVSWASIPLIQTYCPQQETAYKEAVTKQVEVLKPAAFAKCLEEQTKLSGSGIPPSYERLHTCVTIAAAQK